MPGGELRRLMSARSPKGHMFCKECIYQTLLAQKQENKKRVKEWEDNEQRKKVRSATLCECAC